MKRLLILASIAILSASSCSVRDAMTSVTPNNCGDMADMTFAARHGRADSTASKMSYSFVEGIAVWQSGDKLLVFVDDGQPIGTLELLSGEGSPNGVFSGKIDKGRITPGDKFSVVYRGGGSNTVYTDNPSRMIIRKEQPGEQGDFQCDNGTYAICRGLEYTDDPQQTYQGTLQHCESLMRVVVSTTDTKLTSLKYTGSMFYCQGMPLAGIYAEKPGTGVGIVNELVNDTVLRADYIECNLPAPVAIKGATISQIAAVAPVDLTGKDFYVVCNFVSDDGTTHVSVPKKLSGKAMQPGKVYTVDLSGITLEDAAPWCNPVWDTTGRYINPSWDVRWAYGNESTLFCTYGNDYTINAKVYGDIPACMKAGGIPASLQPLFINDLNLAVNIPSKLVINGCDTYSFKDVLPLKDDCTAAVKLYKQGNYAANFGKMLLLNAAGEPVWAYNIWGYVSGFGFLYQGNDNKNPKVARAIIGGAYYFTSAGRVNYSSELGCVFQWGRPFGLAYDEAMRSEDKPMAGASLLAGIRDCADSRIIGNSDWRPSGSNDLWGETKTIFDPCPKGWKVITKDIGESMAGVGGTYYLASGTFTTSGTDKNIWKSSNRGNNIQMPCLGYLPWDSQLCPARGISVAAQWTSSTATTAGTAHGIVWNFTGDASSYTTNGTSLAEKLFTRQTTDWGTANAFPVRCVEDKDNR